LGHLVDNDRSLGAGRKSLSSELRGKPPHELLVAHTPTIQPVSQVRSTLIQSSLTALRERGHFERYLDHLDARQRTTVLQTVAPVWLPVEVAHAHYGACEALQLSAPEVMATGEIVGHHLQGILLRVMIENARMAGLTPWSLFVHAKRLWDRSFCGGSVCLWKEAPKDARIEVRSSVLCRFDYFREALRGQFAMSARLCGARAVAVRSVVWNASTDCFVMHASWV
jgi:hypothetical protein